MSLLKHYHYRGELKGPLYPLQAVAARNHVFPLNTEFDYAVQAQLDDLPARRSYVLPSVLYRFLKDLIMHLSAQGLAFDMVLIRLGAPILENMPDELLAPNVFISVDNPALLDLAHHQGKRRVLSIEHDFLIHYVNDFGNNQIQMSIYYENTLDPLLDTISGFMSARNIHGEFTCL